MGEWKLECYNGTLVQYCLIRVFLINYAVSMNVFQIEINYFIQNNLIIFYNINDFHSNIISLNNSKHSFLNLNKEFLR